MCFIQTNMSRALGVARFFDAGKLVGDAGNLVGWDQRSAVPPRIFTILGRTSLRLVGLRSAGPTLLTPLVACHKRALPRMGGKTK